MCGRYFVDSDALPIELLEVCGLAMGETVVSGADICPGMQAPVICRDEGELRLQSMRWGFERPEGGLVINARAETADQRLMFKGLAERQRCALPATRYYEWRRADRQKYAVSIEDCGLFFLAGLYRTGVDCWEFVVLTQPPTPRIAAVHNRMPLLLDSRQKLDQWLWGDMPFYRDDRRLRVLPEGPEQLSMLFN